MSIEVTGVREVRRCGGKVMPAGTFQITLSSCPHSITAIFPGNDGKVQYAAKTANIPPGIFNKMLWTGWTIARERRRRAAAAAAMPKQLPLTRMRVP